MIQAEIFYDQGYITRLFGIERQRLAFIDGTKAAAARAGVAQNQEGRRLVAPTLADVRTARLLAHRVQVFFPHDALQAKIVCISGSFDFDPVGMSSAHNAICSNRSKRSSRPNRWTDRQIFLVIPIVQAFFHIVITEDLGEIVQKPIFYFGEILIGT